MYISPSKFVFQKAAHGHIMYWYFIASTKQVLHRYVRPGFYIQGEGSASYVRCFINPVMYVYIPHETKGSPTYLRQLYHTSAINHYKSHSIPFFLLVKSPFTDGFVNRRAHLRCLSLGLKNSPPSHQPIDVRLPEAQLLEYSATW